MGVLRITPMNTGPDDSLPILRVAGDTVSLTTSTSSARATNPTSGTWLRLVADEAMMVKLGNSGVNAAVATDFPLAANIPEYFPMDGNSHTAAVDVA